MTEVNAYVRQARRGFEKLNFSQDSRKTAIAHLERWLTDDRFLDARPQLEYLIDAEKFEILFDAFFRQIPFGTGGRRGPVGFGTNRINRFTVATSIQGHCEFLRKHFPDVGDLAVVIAFDVRIFKDLLQVYDPDRDNPLLGRTSRDFARDAAQVYAASGIRAWFPAPSRTSYISTPELSFTIRRLGAQGGLNISASHNHPDDNGAKIYNSTGGQEIPPLDEEMAAIVESIEEAKSMPWDEAVAAGLIRWIPEEVREAYIATNVATSIDPRRRSARIIFTPLHGTGWSSVGATLQQAGFEVECFPGQASPDGTFPGVPFLSPNPEVRESLEAATEYAKEKGADLALAADPDADRLGLVAPDRDGDWVFLNGNQIGVLLAAYLFPAASSDPRRERPFGVTTVVTTSLFRRLAEAHGVRVIHDLGIGFKYIADILAQVEKSGAYRDLRASPEDFVLGIEESHGYLVTPEIRDKDAAGAALLLAELASRLKEEGRSLLDFLDDIYRRFSYVSTFLVSTVMRGARGFDNIRKIQQSLRQSPPESVGGLAVLQFVDRWDESGPLGPILSGTDRAARDLLSFELEGGARIILRPSGTESKNKIYVELSGAPLGADASARELRRQKEAIDSRAKRIARDFTLLMLEMIDVRLPRYALEVSDLVPLECKQDFASTFMPELTRRLSASEEREPLDGWIDGHLGSYGRDGRLLVKHAVEAYCIEERPPREIEAGLREIFALTG